RNTGKGEAAARDMTGDVEGRRLDLQDLATVRQFAEGVDTGGGLINNPGVVTVSSLMHWMGYISLRDLNWTSRPYSAWVAYGQSKLANLLFTSELQRRLAAAGSPLRALASHPGYSHTNLQGRTGRKFGDAVMSAATRVLATDADFGARQTLYAASQDVPGNSFIGPSFGTAGRSRPVGRSPLAKRAGTGSALWELSERLTETKFPL